MKLASLAAACAAAFAVHSATYAAETIHIKMANMQATPQEVTVHNGDTVIWDNEDIVPHTVTEDVAKGKPRFDSGQINAGGHFQWVVKGKNGTINYKCLFHPTMKAKLKLAY